MDIAQSSKHRQYCIRAGVVLLIVLVALWAYYPIGAVPMVCDTDLAEQTAALVEQWKFQDSDESPVSTPVAEMGAVVYGAGYAAVRGHMRVDGEPYTYSTVFKHIPLTEQYLYLEKRDFSLSGSEIIPFLSHANLALVYERLGAFGGVIIAEYTPNWGIIISTLILFFGNSVRLWYKKRTTDWP